MYLTEDGWFCPGYPDCAYLIFTRDEDGGWRYRAAVTVNAWGPDGERFDSEGQAQFWKYIAEEVGIDASDATTIHPWTPDLNRNGLPETLRVIEIDGGQRLEVWEGDELLYEEEGYYAHTGWNAVFLCPLKDGDYLLRYHPTMYQGWCTYSYELITLENGQETIAGEKSVTFDLNFGPMHESFDPSKIAGFMEDLNGMLNSSAQLINTDEKLLSAFEKYGRLHDDLWWLDTWEPVFVRDDGKTLLENLRAFQAAMEAEHYAEEPTLFAMNETETNTHALLRYRDRSTQFDSDWAVHFQPAEHVNIQMLDLNGDGRDEIVFPLVWGHGTGVYIEKLYVFDAETLKQYDTSGLNEMILNHFQSTGDEDNFYLSGAGLNVTIPKSEAQEMNEYAPVADTICFEEIIRYTIKDGKVFCWLGCDASGGLINYIGYINVPVRMTSSGDFVCGQAQYIDDPFLSF
ncbi:MAG: hypothetical protein K2O11_04205, partial [Oscillospiraceae bacterium]|nr:hypothetical protein [Oscillospiraceae bacterium]